MNRRKLIAALAGWLAIPALAAAQTDSPRFTSEATPPRLDAPVPTHLPEPGATISPEPNFIKSAAPPGLAAEIVAPVKIEPKPALTIEEQPYDPRPFNQQRMGRRGAIGDAGDPDAPAPFSFAPPANSLVWVVPEWLLWKTSGMHVPALVTGSPFGTAQSSAGVMGTGNTNVLFGNDSQDGSFRSGLRVHAGFWIDQTQTLGFDAGIFYLNQASRNFSSSTSGNTTSLNRPYSDAVSGNLTSETVAYALRNADGTVNSLVTGGITARTTSDLWGADANFRRFLFANDSIRIDGLLGFRYQRLRDSIETDSTSTINSAGAISDLAAGSVLRIRDAFETTNNFYGGQVGFNAQYQRDRWLIGVTGKVALGVTQHELQLNGSTAITPSGGTTQTVPGGLLADKSNIGRYQNARFSVIPELGMNIGYQLTSNTRIFAGYSLLYWSNVVRAGDQIDQTVNATQLQRTTTAAATLSGPSRPAATLTQSGYWAHGANVGIEFRW